MEPTEYKSPFKSRTIWGLILTFLTLVLSLFKIDLDKGAALDFIDFLDQAWPQIVGFFTLVLAAYGRIKANKIIRVTKKPVEPPKDDGDSDTPPPVGTLVPILMVLMVPLTARSGESPIVVEGSPSVDDIGFYVDGFSTGFFPTAGNDPLPYSEFDAQSAFGGGAMLGYKFNDQVSVAAGGQLVRSGATWLEQYHLDLMVYLPSEAGLPFFEEFISIPDLGNAQVYLLLGAGVQRVKGSWDSLLRAGLGTEMPILEDKPNFLYFVEGTYNVIGIGSESLWGPYVMMRTGIRIHF